MTVSPQIIDGPLGPRETRPVRIEGVHLRGVVIVRLHQAGNTYVFSGADVTNHDPSGGNPRYISFNFAAQDSHGTRVPNGALRLEVFRPADSTSSNSVAFEFRVPTGILQVTVRNSRDRSLLAGATVQWGPLVVPDCYLQ